MKHLKISLLISLLLGMGGTRVYADVYNRYDYDACIDGIYYKFYGQSASVIYKYAEVFQYWDPEEDEYIEKVQNYHSDYSGNITIPKSVTYNNNTYNVTLISQHAFDNCSNLTSIALPSSITRINDYAFRQCYGLTSVTIGKNVNYIGDYAFYLCYGLTSVTIGKNVNYIGDYAFTGCSLTTVTVKNTNPLSIDGAWSLDGRDATLYVPAGSKAAYEAADYWKDFKNIVENPNISFADANVEALCVTNWDSNGDGGLSEEETDEVTDLGTVFKNNTSITSFDELSYFTGLSTIGEQAFYGCTSLTSISIPSNITSIGEDAFYNTNSLQRVNITDLEAWCGISFGSSNANPLSYAHYLYLNGERIDDLVIPNSISILKSYAFYHGYFSSVTIPSTTSMYLGSGHFMGAHIGDISISQAVGDNCFRLATISHLIINPSVNTISDCSFYRTEVEKLDIPYSENDLKWESGRNSDGLFEWATIGTATIDRRIKASFYGSHVESTFKNTSITKLTVGSHALYWSDFLCASCTISDLLFDGITGITSNAFNPKNSYTNTITNIYLPQGLTSIGSGAFDNCRISSVTVENDTPLEIDNTTFSGRSSATLYVPAGSKSAYEATTYWQDFKEIVEMADEVTIGSAGMGTFCSTHALDFSGTDDIKAYIVSAFKPRTGEVILTRITDVPANTGIVVKGNADTYTLPWGPGETFVSNMLVGVTENTVLNKVDGDYTNYILAKKNGNLGFFAVADGSTLSAGKAYLPLPTASLPSSAGARGMMLVFDDETTGIIDVQNNIQNVRGIYNLQGQRVENPRKGLHIVNGKKVMMK